jgi:hypothetical protein
MNLFDILMVKRKVVCQMDDNHVKFCECENVEGVYSESDDLGWWYRCRECNKVIEGSFEYHSNELDSDF